METLITTQELARRLGCSDQTIRNCVRNGTIPAIRFAPQTLRFNWSEVWTHINALPTHAERVAREDNQ